MHISKYYACNNVLGTYLCDIEISTNFMKKAFKYVFIGGMPGTVNGCESPAKTNKYLLLI